MKHPFIAKLFHSLESLSSNWFLVLVVLISGTMTSAYFFWDKKPFFKKQEVVASDSKLYNQSFPNHSNFLNELKLLRQTKRLEQKNEMEILESIHKVSKTIHMPSAILWCLVFQESRLNHLVNFGSSGTTGLGQFSRFSFHEVNYDLTKFSSKNLNLFTEILGKDVRPISPNTHSMRNPSSYYSIPTAVTSTAAYLNNRFIQLKRILDRQNVSYDQDVLWLHATMAYNKGTRGTTQLWKKIKKVEPNAIYSMFHDVSFLKKHLAKRKLITSAFRSIWREPQASLYAEELRIHIKNMMECSMAPQSGITMSLNEGSSKTNFAYQSNSFGENQP